MNIVLIGYGRMGRAIEKVAIERGHRIVLTIDAGEDNKFESETFASADVVIEFTGPDTAVGNCIRAMEHRLPVVCGSTGFMNEETHKQLKDLCDREGGTFFYASNFSVGVNILFALNRQLARLMAGREEYRANLTETHHIHKVDAPSGTAITLAEELIAQEGQGYHSWQLAEQIVGTPNSDVLPIESIREGEVTGIHEISYTSDIDCISIRHEAFNRSGFALGAVLAAEYTSEHTGMLSMSQLLSIDN